MIRLWPLGLWDFSTFWEKVGLLQINWKYLDGVTKTIYSWENPFQRIANSRRTDTQNQINTVKEELNQVNGEKEAETKERYDKIWKLKNDLDEVERSTEQHKVYFII